MKGERQGKREKGHDNGKGKVQGRRPMNGKGEGQGSRVMSRGKEKDKDEGQDERSR